MPFVSEKQRKYLWAKKPEVAKEFAEKEKTRKEVFKMRAAKKVKKKITQKEAILKRG